MRATPSFAIALLVACSADGGDSTGFAESADDDPAGSDGAASTGSDGAGTSSPGGSEGGAQCATPPLTARE